MSMVGGTMMGDSSLNHPFPAILDERASRMQWKHIFNDNGWFIGDWTKHFMGETQKKQTCLSGHSATLE